jgi:hypothetical protein
MSVKSVFASALLFLGIFLILIALISAYFFLMSFIERQSHGSGLLFADVELFALAVIIFGVFGTIAIIISKKISKPDGRDKKESAN